MTHSITPKPSVPTHAPLQRGFWSRLGRAGVRVLGALVLLVICGTMLQWALTVVDRYRYPAPGTLVDIGGYRLHLFCQGTGTPTVVLDAGLGDSLLTWASVQPALAQTTRVCSYDRAGLGWSERGNQPRTLAAMTQELHTLLTNAQIPGPYVLAGHSFGGYLVQYYAFTYPDDVAGLVLIDSSLEDLGIRAPTYQTVSTPPDIVYTVGKGFIITGIGRLMAPFFPADSDRLPIAARGAAQAFEQNLGVVSTSIEEAKQRPLIEAEMRHERHPFGNIPLRILTHDPAAVLPANIPSDMRATLQAVDPIMQALYTELAAQSSHGSVQMIPGSGHYIQLDAPEAVITEIHTLLEDILSNHEPS